ncbi:hypothetical protein OAO87_00985 [bacterium]|nr:hypothetical protein [bacterium]
MAAARLAARGEEAVNLTLAQGAERAAVAREALSATARETPPSEATGVPTATSVTLAAQNARSAVLAAPLAVGGQAAATQRNATQLKGASVGGVAGGADEAAPAAERNDESARAVACNPTEEEATDEPVHLTLAPPRTHQQAARSVFAGTLPVLYSPSPRAPFHASIGMPRRNSVRI